MVAFPGEIMQNADSVVASDRIVANLRVFNTKRVVFSFPIISQ